jgi:hypothetical protein
MNYSTINHINTLIDKGFVYYKINDVQDKQLLAVNDDISDPDQVKELLHDTLAELQGNAVKIILSAKNSEAKAQGGAIAKNFILYYKLQAQNNGGIDLNAIRGGNGLDSTKLLDIVLNQSIEIGNLKVAAMQADLDKKFEILKMELSGAKNADQTTDGDKLIQTLYGDVKTFLMAKQGILPNRQISGQQPPLKAVKTPSNQQEANDILNQSITKLAQADSNILGNLQKLADIAESNPDLYNQLVEGLNTLATGTNG